MKMSAVNTFNPSFIQIIILILQVLRNGKPTQRPKCMEEKLESIRDLQEFLSGLYATKNNAQSFEYLYSFASQNCAYLARSVEKNSDPSPYFISSFSWICALGSHLNIDIYDAFYRKFPGCCPYCLERSCVCSITGKTSLKYKNQREASAERENIYRSYTKSAKQRIGTTASTLNTIYPSNRVLWKTHGPSYHFSRLFEELGEVYEAYCSYKINGEEYKKAVAEEISDCIAWLLSAWDIEYPKQNFSDAFFDYYAHNCPVCLKQNCICRDHYSRNKSLHSERDLQLLLESLAALASAITHGAERTPTVNEAVKLIAAASAELKLAAQEKSTSDVKSLVNRNDDFISQAKSMLNSIPEIANKFNTLFEAYENLKNNLPWT